MYLFKVLKYSIYFLLVTKSVSLYANGLSQVHLDIPIKLLSNEVVTLSDFKDEKPIYLKFWATWCQPCIQEMRHFQNIQQKYGDSIKVIGINIGVNDDVQAVNKIINRFGLSMPMAIDSNGDLVQAFSMMGTPYHLLINKNGNVIHQGHEASEILDKKISLVSQDEIVDSLDADALVDEQVDINFKMVSDERYALFFTATWCDWYLKDSRPKMSRSCVIAQEKINQLNNEFSDVIWLGVASRLWTGVEELLSYKKNT